MGNTAKFDRQQVVEKATDLYWQKGFHATSMRNLQDVIDMRPGSIYAAFGSKEGLFKEALNNYTTVGLAQLAQCRAEASSPIRALKRFMRKMIIDTQQDAPSGICMLTKTVAELNEDHQELLDQARAALSQVEAEFQKLIEEAQQLGEVDASKEAKRLASHVQIQIAGLRSYAKTGGTPEQLAQLIEEVFEHHPF